MRKRLRSALIKNTIHYIVVVGIFLILIAENVGIKQYFPLGTTEQLFDSASAVDLHTPLHAGRLDGGSQLGKALFFTVCFLSSILLSVPVGRTYLATHRRKTIDASIAKAIIILPIAVTGLVLIVQNSLALAFSLAGIVAGAGIRFRTNIREFTDTLFFLIAIGIGLAAGVGSLGLALIMSIIFSYLTLIVSAIDYGKVPAKAKSPETTEKPGPVADESRSESI